MRSFRKDFRIALFVLVGIFVVAQVFRADRTNPPVKSEISAHSSVKPVLKRACYDCHSNETIWPWYSHVAPASWLVANDVNGGRKHLNFSEWGSYRSDVQSKKLEEIIEEVEEGEMPLWYYSLAHPEAKLGREDLSLLKSWVRASLENAEPKY